MKTRTLATAGLVTIGILAVLAWPNAAGPSLPTTTPEDVGLSSKRLTRINEMMERRITAGDISGGVTVVARKGRIAHFEAHGMKDFETQVPMTTDGVFSIASMTKVITGVAILMMVEEGRLHITDPVSQFIPEFKNVTVAVAHPALDELPGDSDETPNFYTVPVERDITVRDLLTHTSGLVSGPMSRASEQAVSRQPDDTLADYVPRLGQTALEFQPGSRWSYSPGAGFTVLGRIVEIVSGMSLDQFLRQRMFEPLGMKDTAFYATESLKPRLITAYQHTDDGVVRDPRTERVHSRIYFEGAGGLMTTAASYLRFGQMLLNGGELDGVRLLSPRTVEQMVSPHIPDTLPGRPVGEGFGLSVRVLTNAVEGGSRLSNGAFGWGGAFGTFFWVSPRDELVAVMMTATQIRAMRAEFENAVMQAIVE